MGFGWDDIERIADDVTDEAERVADDIEDEVNRIDENLEGALSDPLGTIRDSALFGGIADFGGKVFERFAGVNPVEQAGDFVEEEIFDPAVEFAQDEIIDPVEDFIDDEIFKNPFEVNIPEEPQYQDPQMPSGAMQGMTVLDQLTGRQTRKGVAPRPGGGRLRYKTLLGQ